MKITVSELLVRFMERLGVSHIFGIPGAHILPVYDCLYDSPIKTVLVKHEQGAAFMAGGLARVSGGIGACIATAGPGSTNLVTGIANAYADKQPILIVTGETSTYIFGKGGLQESSGEGGAINQAALFGGITRYHKIIERTDYLGQVLNRAARILLSAAPGPVLLSLPYNVQKEEVEENLLDGINFHPMAALKSHAPANELVELIAEARYPVIVAGHGCVQAGAQAAVAHLSESLNIPVTTSLKAKGVISEGAALSLGSLGVTSDGRAYRYIVEHADLLIFLGAGFNERTSYLWDNTLLAGKKIVQVDIDEGQLEKVFKADLAIHGDLGAVLDDLLTAVETAAVASKSLDRLAGHAVSPSPEKFRLMERFFTSLAARFQEDVQIFDDNIIFAQRFFKSALSNRYFPNSGISSLGHAIQAAIGARFANPRPTFAILGDGGFQMCCMEIMTAVNYAIPLNIVVIDNAAMGLIRKNQSQLYGGRYIDCDFVNPDFAYLALAFGIRHWKIEAEADVDALFAKADLTGSINLIEIMLDKNAFPDYWSNR